VVGVYQIGKTDLNSILNTSEGKVRRKETTWKIEDGIKMDLRKMWSGLNWLRIGTYGGLLGTQ
jgi:hypothetical protein